MDLRNTYRTSHPKAINTYSSQVHMEHSSGEIYMLDHKTSLSTFKKAKSIASTSSSHNVIKPAINCKKTGKFTNMQGLKNMLLNNPRVNEEISKEKSKNTLRQMKMEMQLTKSHGIHQEQF